MNIQLTSKTKNMLRVNYYAWMVFFFVFNLYCVFWRQYGLGIGYDFVDSLIWFAKEWGAWLIISAPFLLACDHLVDTKWPLAKLLLLGITVLTMTTLLRIQVDSGEYTGMALTTISVTLFPKYFVMLLGYLVAWYVYNFVHLHRPSSTTLPSELQQPQAELNTTAVQASIVVEHLGVQRALDVADIVSLKAARNYVEIEGVEGSYIKRSTFKQLLQELTEQGFMQVHRSYALNLNNLHKISNSENGSAVAVMSNDVRIPVSKSFKAALKAVVV